MKTTVFKLIDPSSERVEPIFGPLDTVYRIPTLPAYSIIDHSFDSTEYSPYETGGHRAIYRLQDDCLHIEGVKNEFFHKGIDRFVIHYAGIRDYSLLFPHIEDQSSRSRLGRYAEEAEVSFESGAWLSFMMMAGAVIEGLLDECTPSSANTFDKMIKKAEVESTLSEKDALLCHKVKYARNLIHLRRHGEAYIDRSLAMDTYVFYDELIKRHWGVLKTKK
jgi:hypothetical protein